MSRYPDSNRGPTHYECVALPTEPYRQPFVLTLLKPYVRTPAGARTLDTLIKSQVLYQLSYGCNFQKERRSLSSFCTPAGARTLDTLIKSQVLYQLSYGCNFFVLRVQRYTLFLKPPNFFPIFFKKVTGGYCGNLPDSHICAASYGCRYS